MQLGGQVTGGICFPNTKVSMQPQTVTWLAKPSVALAQALAVMGPFPAFGQATLGLAYSWLQSPTLWWDRFAVAFW